MNAIRKQLLTKIVIVTTVLWLFPTSVAAQNFGFGENHLLDQSAESLNRLPRIEFTDNGFVNLLWAGGTNNHESVFHTRAESGAEFDERLILSPNLGVSGVRMTLTSSGNHLIAGWWERSPDRAVRICLSDDQGESWDAPVRANPPADVTNAYQAAAVFPNGRASTMWMTYPIQGPEMNWTRQQFGGDFVTPIVISSILEDEPCECCDSDQIILDDLTVIAAYRNVDPNNIRDIHVIRSIDGGETFPEVIRVDWTNWHIVGCPSTGPSMDNDGETVAMTWMSAADGTSRIMMSLSSDGGATWSENTEIDPDNTGPSRNHPEVAIRGETVVIVWHEYSDDTGEDIFASVSWNSGQTWSDQIPVSDAAEYSTQTWPDVDISPDGEILAVWQDNRDGYQKIYYAWGEDFTSVEDEAPLTSLPNGFSIKSYPNPFNPVSTITVFLPETSELMLQVQNILGEQIATLANGSYSAGEHEMTFDGSRFGSGIYFINVSIDNVPVTSRKIVLVK
jgi:Secretion system C-terminal sorting domain